MIKRVVSPATASVFGDGSGGGGRGLTPKGARYPSGDKNNKQQQSREEIVE